MKIGDEVLIHGYIDEIRKDTIIIRNDGGYFGTVPSEVADQEPNPFCALAGRECPFQGKEYAWCLTCPHISEEDRALVKKVASEPKRGKWINYTDTRSTKKSRQRKAIRECLDRKRKERSNGYKGFNSR